MNEVSPRGFLIEYVKSDVVNVSATSTVTTISQLVPDTEYRFRVSALTENGQGPEMILVQATAPADGGML